MIRSKVIVPVVIVAAFLVGNWWAAADEKKQPVEQERAVTEKEVPEVALAALKKLSGGAAFTEFAEEIEHGQKYFEGSWKGPDGNVDALVTEAGDVVEIEEKLPATKIPAGVRAAAEKTAGKDASMSFERKTVYMYEIHYKKDGKTHEAIFTADGRTFHEEGQDGEKGEEEEEKP